jgi:hypothetical protein
VKVQRIYPNEVRGRPGNRWLGEPPGDPAKSRVGVGMRVTVTRKVIGGRNVAAEFRRNARVQVAGAGRDSRFSLSKVTSNAKGER